MLCTLGLKVWNMKVEFLEWRHLVLGWAMNTDNENILFFIWLSRLVSVYNNKNKNLPSSRFLFILLQTETKRLSWIKKSYIFIISVHCPTQCQVPPILNSTFNFQTLIPIIQQEKYFLFFQFNPFISYAAVCKYAFSGFLCQYR